MRVYEVASLMLGAASKLSALRAGVDSGLDV